MRLNTYTVRSDSGFKCSLSHITILMKVQTKHANKKRINLSELQIRNIHKHHKKGKKI